jgi:hypothetical protein
LADSSVGSRDEVLLSDLYLATKGAFPLAKLWAVNIPSVHETLRAARFESRTSFTRFIYTALFGASVSRDGSGDIWM